MTETIVGRYNFQQQADAAALARTISTGITHYAKADAATDTFVVYIPEAR